MALPLRSLLTIGASSASWAFSFGLGSQAVSQWLKFHGRSDTVIGLSHSFYYFGLALASCLVPAITRRVGAPWCAGIGMLFSGLTLAMFPWGGDDWAWYALRFLNGCAGAMSLIPLETMVSRDSPPERKTLNFGIYGVSLTVGGALGIGGAPYLYPAGYLFAFSFGAAAALAAAGAVLVGLRGAAEPSSVRPPKAHLGWRRNFLSYGTAWSQGFLEGGMLAFLVLFLESRGLSTEAAGTLMGVTMIGVILWQVPMSWLGDRYGKTPMLLACYGVVVLGLITIPWLPNSIWLAAALFAFGACTGAMYPLGLSLLGEQMPEESLARAFAWYLAIECVGSQAGAAAMGGARDWWGETAMFPVGLAAVLGVLVAWLALKWIPHRTSVEGNPFLDENQHRSVA